MANNKVAYGIAKGLGIDTSNMSPKEVWEAIAKKKGVSVEQAQKQSENKESKDGRKTTVEKLQELTKVKEYDKAENIPSDLDALLGEEFKGVKGQDAVNKLLKEKRGHVKGAFYREDIGDIDLFWGSDSVGLKHIIQRRDEQGINVDEFLSNLADVVEKGEFKKRNERGNFEFWYKGKMAIIAPEYHGNKITYLVTAFKRKKIKPPKET